MSEIIEKDRIKKDNKLIEAAISGLSKNSFKLLLYMTTEIVMENLEEMEDGYKLTFKNKSFLDSINCVSENGYSEVKKYLKQLRSINIEMPLIENGQEVGHFGTGFIDKYWVYKKGFSTVKFDKEMMPYLYKFKVEKDTTIMRYNLMKQFDSMFSMRIYELLIRWKNTTHKSVTIELGNLKSKLGVKGKYPSIKDFDVKVLAVAKKEINALSDIIMEYKKLALGETKGKGRKPITHIEFTFKLKNEQQQEELLTEKQIKELLEIADKRTIGTNRTGKEFYEYAFSVTLEGCKNNRGFYKYMKSVLKGDNIFLGQVSMFTNPDVRAKVKSNQMHKELFEEKKNKTAELKRKIEEETLAYLEGEQKKKKNTELKIEQAKKTDEVKSIDDVLRRVLDENHKTNS